MRLYLDVCCYCRAFDDLSQPRMREESFSLDLIYRAASAGRLTIIGSEALEREATRGRDSHRNQVLLATMARLTADRVPFGEAALLRADALKHFNIRDFDALHVASALEAKADWFLTVDDKLLARLGRALAGTAMKASDPVRFVETHTDLVLP